MEFKLKKFVYLINDLTNAVLKKDREEETKCFKKALFFLLVLLFISLVFNILQYLNIF